MTTSDVLYLNGRKIDWEKPPKATTRVMWSYRDTSGRKVTGSFRTIAFLTRMSNAAERRYGARIHVIQPPYNTTVAASAGTHDYDDCLDWYIPGVSWWEMQKFWRANGGWGWYRYPPKFGNHMHGGCLPVREGKSISDDFKVGGFKVGKYVDGGYSLYGYQVTSSQIEDYYNHAFGLSGAHTKNSDKSWFPSDIESKVWSLGKYVAMRARKQRAEAKK